MTAKKKEKPLYLLACFALLAVLLGSLLLAVTIGSVQIPGFTTLRRTAPGASTTWF